MKFRTSVGKSLILLVSCHAVVVVFIVVVALLTMDGIALDSRRMYEFQLQCIAAIGEAIHQASTLEDGVASAPLAEFVKQYESQWEVASGVTPEAVRFRRILLDIGETDLPERESKAL